MEFRVLGDLEVRRDGVAIPLGPRQQRAVLALLVLHAGDVVAVDRIVDDLWGEAPPPTAAKTVHVYVSRLRKALGDGAGEAIVTRDHGYVLQVAPEQVDALRFERLLTEGRRAFADGDARRAADVLAEALDLWRGPPLGLAFPEAERAEVARLEELRLEALETRVEADLALGRQAEVVPELEVLAARHPLREPLHRQRMLALYRCGRQPEALAVYHETRRRLVDELGLEPSAAMRDLHDAMLRQDPALDAPTPEPPGTEQRMVTAGGSRRLTVGLAALALVGGITVVLVLLARGGGAPAATVTVPANNVAVIDPGTGSVVASVPVGLRPGTAVEVGGSVWVPNLDDATITRIDPVTQGLQGTSAHGGSVTGIAAGGGALWVGDATSAKVRRLDPALGTVTRVTALPGGIAGPQGTDIEEPLAFAVRSLWAGHRGVVTRLDARRGRRVARIPIGLEVVGIASGAGAIWVVDDLYDNVLRVVDDAVVEHIPTGQGPAGIAVGAGAVWVAQRFDGTVARIDPVTARITNTIRVGREPRGVAVLGDSVWVTNSGDGTVSQIDARTRRVVGIIPVGNSPADVAAIRGRLWVSVQASAATVSPAPNGRRGGVVRFDRADALVGLNESLDPALAYSPGTWQVLYATCAKLYNYPDASGAAGDKIVPEVARGQPRVSRDRLQQTFTIRRGFRLSPPSGARVTAQTFRHAIERSVDPRWHDSPAAPYLDDVVGANAFEHGRARHIAGVLAARDRLVIRTTRPASDLALRLSMPFFCAVPADAPPRHGGIWNLPTAGPYYVASATKGRQVVLRRNPNYHGPRPARADAIDIRLDTPPRSAVARVTAGVDDYYQPPGGPRGLPQLTDRHQARYGPVRQRLFVNEAPGEQYIALNTARPLFAHARLRRAVSYAIDRAALAAQTAPDSDPLRPTDQYLTSSMLGYRNAALYPLHGDLTRARRLAGAVRHHARLLTYDFAPFTKWAAIVRANLARIGIDVTIDPVPASVYTARIGNRNADYDLAFFGWYADFPDPHNVLNALLRGNHLPANESQNKSFFNDARYNRRLDIAARLSGAARYEAYARLDAELAGKESPIIAFGIPIQRDYFSTRIGCQVFQPAGGGIDLAALCRKHR